MYDSPLNPLVARVERNSCNIALHGFEKDYGLARIASAWPESRRPGLDIGMSVAAAFLLNEVGGRVSWTAGAGIMLMVVGYSLSDINIKALIDVFEHTGMRAPFIAAWIAYIFCGGVGVVMLCIRGWPARRVWVYAVPHALTWLSSMVLFYCMVAIIGVVFSVIVQSTRGVISVGLGAIIARWGFLHLEHHVDRKTFWKRMAAAILMTAAIALYAFS